LQALKILMEPWRNAYNQILLNIALICRPHDLKIVITMS
jgi:hypothetical protein